VTPAVEDHLVRDARAIDVACNLESLPEVERRASPCAKPEEPVTSTATSTSPLSSQDSSGPPPAGVPDWALTGTMVRRLETRDTGLISSGRSPFELSPVGP
jgi:hypothetical protein